MTTEKTLGQVAYEAYGVQTMLEPGTTTQDTRPMVWPDWPRSIESDKAWEAAAQAVAAVVRQECEEDEPDGVTLSPEQYEQARAALRHAADRFREYESHHAKRSREPWAMAKHSESHTEKAERNAASAAICEAALAGLEPCGTPVDG